MEAGSQDGGLDLRWRSGSKMEGSSRSKMEDWRQDGGLELRWSPEAKMEAWS